MYIPNLTTKHNNKPKITQNSQQTMPQPQPQPHYTLILRLPFPRPPGQHFETNSTVSHSHPTQQTQTLENTQRPSNPSPPKSTSRSPAAAPSTQPPPTGSEGTPSMGSSFSDLSGASVAQSALEEALMSDLRADGGGLGSRVSTIGR
jgi:hypothetical protein